ncbi:MAG: Xaa-Pro peptidase family protein [Desulfuromonadaceae bacterium]|nr:Xaa-Pro peptidase family protein [Desulfuromonadaceae bacterium]
MLDSRLSRLQLELRKNKLDAVLLLDPVHLRYYSGFSGSDGALVITPDLCNFRTDSRYISQATAEVSAASIEAYTTKHAALVELLQHTGASRVGFEASTLSVAELSQLSDLDPSIVWEPLKHLGELRQVKDYAELECLEQAADINATAFDKILAYIRPGVTERKIAIELEYALRCCGGEDKAFDFIVASGWRGAYPHGVASDKTLEAGELVTIDFGTQKSGYYSDETVTLAIGEVEQELRDIHACVLKAHDLALEVLAPSVMARDVDRVARDHIEACGYGKYFGHGLGHGIGLAVHEGPTLSPRSEVMLTAGMVFTIEPGIYIPDFGGVRIEDTVLLTNDGHRVLTSVPKKLRTLPIK